MRNPRSNAVRCRRALFLAIAAVALSAPAAVAQDASKVWSVPATTGTVDEADIAKVAFTATEAALVPGPQPTTAVVRYNVVAVDGLFADLTPTSWPDLFLRYRDAGGRERVRARLVEVDLSTGASRTAIVFDSDLFPQSSERQTQGIGDCGAFSQFEFGATPSGKSYYVELELVRNALGGDPRVEIVGLSRFGVCP